MEAEPFKGTIWNMYQVLKNLLNKYKWIADIYNKAILQWEGANLFLKGTTANNKQLVEQGVIKKIPVLSLCRLYNNHIFLICKVH